MVGMAANSGEVKGEKKNMHIDAAKRAKKQIFKKRKECIMKKSMELSVLCDVKVCAIIVEPDGKIETWPENKHDLMEIYKLYKGSENHTNIKNRVFECGNEAALIEVPDHHHHHHLDDDAGLNLQKEWDDGLSWIEGLSETSANDFLTQVTAEMNAVQSRMDMLKRTSTSADDDQMNDHDMAISAVVCDADKAKGHSIYDPINLDDDDEMNIDRMPDAVVVCDDVEEAMEQQIIIKDQMNPLCCYDDNQQGVDDWLNALVNWDDFEVDAFMFDSEFWQ